MILCVHLRLASAVALSLVTFGCASPPAASEAHGRRPVTASTPAPLAALSPELRQIAEQVERARGLRFRRPFTIFFVDDDEMRAHFGEGKIDAPPDAAEPSALWAFGLIKKPPASSWLGSLSSSGPSPADDLLGFYVEASRRIYVRERVSTEIAVVAHEMAHALLHDNFEVRYDRESDDEQLAIRSLDEGDATVTAALVVALREGKSASTALRRVSTSTLATRDYVGETDATLGASLPLYHERSLVPYEAGAAFVARVVLARGLAGLDEVWHDPPRGTFEVFHADTYAKGLALPRIDDAPLPAGCRATFEGRMGELRTRAFLRIVEPRSVALAGASGLLADRYALLEGCGSDPAFVWQTAWSDEASAARFERVVERQFDCKEEGCLTGAHTVARRGTAVVVLRGRDDGEMADRALAAIATEGGGAAPRLGGAALDRAKEEPPLVEGSSGRTCRIAGTGVEITVPGGLSLESGHDLDCAMRSDGLDVALTTNVAASPYGDAFLDSIRKLLPASLAASHRRVESRERWRVTPLGTGIGMVYELTSPLELEVVSLPICGGKRVLTLYLRSTNEEGRSILEDALSSLRPSSVGLSRACADPVDL